MPRDFLRILDVLVWLKALLSTRPNTAFLNLTVYVREFACLCVLPTLLRRHDGEDATKGKSWSYSKRMGIYWIAIRRWSWTKISGRMPWTERIQQWTDYSTNPAGTLITIRIWIKSPKSVFHCLVVHSINQSWKESKFSHTRALNRLPLNKRQGNSIS
jgi:hypothetical protein